VVEHRLGDRPDGRRGSSRWRPSQNGPTTGRRSPRTSCAARCRASRKRTPLGTAATVD